jgi:uncharacterized protein YcbX
VNVEFGPKANELELGKRGSGQRTAFDPVTERGALNAWLSDFFGELVEIRRNAAGGYPDVTSYVSGPTVISTATLQAVASWFPGLSVDDMRLRLRGQLGGQKRPGVLGESFIRRRKSRRRVDIDDIGFEEVGPTTRCIMLVRDLSTSERYEEFQCVFVEKREQTLPEWTNIDRFDHYFSLMVNTAVQPSEVGGELRVGDRVRVVGERSIRKHRYSVKHWIAS